jgi:hypothetical protein
MKINRLVIAAVLTLSPLAHADTFSIQCANSEVSCDNLFPDLVSAKFTRFFDHRKWAIFVYSQKFVYGNGSGVASVLVGVVEQNESANSYFPRKRWARAVFRPTMGSAYEQRESLRLAIRKTAESMMVACEDSPTCNVAPRN